MGESKATKAEKRKIIIKKLIAAQTLKELLKARDLAIELYIR